MLKQIGDYYLDCSQIESLGTYIRHIAPDQWSKQHRFVFKMYMRSGTKHEVTVSYPGSIQYTDEAGISAAKEETLASVVRLINNEDSIEGIV